MELLLEALKSKKLKNFLLGKGKYYRNPPQEFFNDPHFYNFSWRNEIIPALNSEYSNEVKNGLNNAFNELLHHEKDINFGIYTFISHLSEYYSALNKSKVIDNFLNLKELEFTLKETLANNKHSLITDFRWAGEKNNKNNKGLGMWGIIIFSLNRIRDKFEGPNLIPQGE